MGKKVTLSHSLPRSNQKNTAYRLQVYTLPPSTSAARQQVVFGTPFRRPHLQSVSRHKKTLDKHTYPVYTAFLKPTARAETYTALQSVPMTARQL